jgi:hypothetical protein
MVDTQGNGHTEMFATKADYAQHDVRLGTLEEGQGHKYWPMIEVNKADIRSLHEQVKMLTGLVCKRPPAKE